MPHRDTSNDRPNILVIHPHNLGRYIGCYDRPVETENIDHLADEGVLFENYFCTAAHCSPARSSMWTGIHPHVNGLVGLAHLGWELHPDQTTLVQYLNEAGYETYLFGLQHISSDAERIGYRHARGSVHEFSVDEPAHRVAGDVESFLLDEAGESQPFFASVGFSEVHREPVVERCLDCGWTFDIEGYESDEPENVEPLGYLPDRPGIREDLADFHGMIYAIDQAVGRITASLEEAGLTSNTLVVFTTDHGIGFPRAMGTCYDPGVEASLIFRWPEQFAPGTVESELLSGVDFTPTILDLIGKDVPEEIEGRSFWPLLTSADYSPRDHLYLEFTWHSKYNPMRAIRSTEYKYIRNFGDLPLVYIPAPIFSSQAGKSVRNDFYAIQRPKEELYDLSDDPYEQHNVIDDPSYEETADELRTQVRQWMERTDDRLLEGEWPPTPEQNERIKKSPWIPRDINRVC